MTKEQLDAFCARCNDLNDHLTDADWAPIFQAHDELVKRVVARIRPGEPFDWYKLPPTAEFLAALTPEERPLYERLRGLIKWTYGGGWKADRPGSSIS